MKTQLLYILVSSPADVYTEQVLVSATSARRRNPSAVMLLLTDSDTIVTPALQSLFDRVIRQDFPADIPPMKRSRRFQLMALIFGAAIILFTYIPGISAKSIGLNCQKSRLHQMISQLKLTDPKTGKFVKELNLEEIRKDSVLSAQFIETCSLISYVRNDVGRDAFEQQYGEWSWFDCQFAGNHDKDDVEETTYILTSPIYLGEYNMMVPTGDYRLREDEGVVKVMRKDSTVLTYPIGERLRKNPKMVDNPDSLFVCKNDSLMLVLASVSVEKEQVTTINTYEFQLFRKRK